MGCLSAKNSNENTNRPHRSTLSGFLSIKHTSIHNDYTFTKRLGEGGFGYVREAEEHSTSTLRAVKTIHMESLPEDQYLILIKEVNILKNLDHPGILKIFEVYREPSYLHIVTELCTGGDLLKKIAEKKVLSENTAAKYMFDIVSAVKYCHENGIVHRDLKPENVLFEDTSEESRLKIIDFGTSTKIKSFGRMKTVLGTPYYIAPEVLNGTYDEKCDVWSIGVILHILLSGKIPFKGRNLSEIFNSINTVEIDLDSRVWKNVSEEAKNLLKRTLKKDPSKRISISEMLNHPWITTRHTDIVPDKTLARRSIRNLIKFHSTNKLQLCTYAFLTHYFTTSADLKYARNLFEALDTNKDGKLSREEIAKGIINYCADFTFDISEIFDQCDIDKNGYIDFSEFINAILSADLEISTKRLYKAFAALDKDGNGSISKEELRTALGDPDDEDILKILNEIDLNGNGLIDRQEFMDAILKITKVGKQEN